MKSFFKNKSLKQISLFLLSVLAFSFTSCNNDEGEAPEPTPTSYVTFYHGSPDAPDLNIYVNNQSINSQAFKYNSYSDYLRFLVGNQKIKFTPHNAVNAFIDTTINFKENKIYSLYVVNKLQDIELLVIQDSVMTLGTGMAGLRIVHVSPDAPAIDVATTGTGSKSVASNLKFKENTLFTDVTTGKQSLQIKKTGTSDVLLSLPDLTFEAGKSYTVLVRGFVTPPTGNTNILSAQFIRNF